MATNHEIAGSNPASVKLLPPTKYFMKKMNEDRYISPEEAKEIERAWFTPAGKRQYKDMIQNAMGSSDAKAAQAYIKENGYRSSLYDDSKFAIAVDRAFSEMIRKVFKKHGLEGSHSDDYVGVTAYCSLLKLMYNYTYGPGMYNAVYPGNCIMLQLPRELSEAELKQLKSLLLNTVSNFDGLWRLKYIGVYPKYTTTVNHSWAQSVSRDNLYYYIPLRGDWDSPAISLNCLKDVKKVQPMFDAIAETVAYVVNQGGNMEESKQKFVKRFEITEVIEFLNTEYPWLNRDGEVYTDPYGVKSQFHLERHNGDTYDIRQSRTAAPHKIGELVLTPNGYYLAGLDESSCFEGHTLQEFMDDFKQMIHDDGLDDYVNELKPKNESASNATLDDFLNDSDLTSDMKQKFKSWLKDKYPNREAKYTKSIQAWREDFNDWVHDEDIPSDKLYNERRATMKHRICEAKAGDICKDAFGNEYTVLYAGSLENMVDYDNSGYLDDLVSMDGYQWSDPAVYIENNETGEQCVRPSDSLVFDVEPIDRGEPKFESMKAKREKNQRLIAEATRLLATFKHS